MWLLSFYILQLGALTGESNKGLTTLAIHESLISSDPARVFEHENSIFTTQTRRRGHCMRPRQGNAFAPAIPSMKFLELIENRKVVLVSGTCTMLELLDYTIPLGWIPKVVPEFKDITVGGAIVGTALESSSFLFGQFNDICERVHVVLGNRKVISCSKIENTDLWNALSGSYGTLGRVVYAEVQCVEYKPWVRVRIQSIADIDNAIKTLAQMCSNQQRKFQCCDETIDFIEALQFPSSKYENMDNGDKNYANIDYGATAIITGMLVKALPTVENQENIASPEVFNVDEFHQPWFYEKIFDVISSDLRFAKRSRSMTWQDASNSTTNHIRELYIPTKAFIFRYDRGAFWCARPTAFSWSMLWKSPQLLPLFVITANTLVCRWLFRKIFTTRILYSLLGRAHPLAVQEKLIVMDVFSPVDRAAALIREIRTHIPISTPLWICPVIRPDGRNIQPFSPHGVISSRLPHCKSSIWQHFADFFGSRNRTTYSSPLMLDFGIYGRVDDGRGEEYSRFLDLWTLRNGARKMLYSHHSFSRDEFWFDGGADALHHDLCDKNDVGHPSHHVPDDESGAQPRPLQSYACLDRQHYLHLRERYGADSAFPDLYDKVCPATRTAAPASFSTCKPCLRALYGMAAYWKIACERIHYWLSYFFL